MHEKMKRETVRGSLGVGVILIDIVIKLGDER